MPTYEFRCPMGHEFEKFYRSIGGAEAQAACPRCGTIAERMMSATGFAFKGSGFYLTDYGKNAHRDKGTPAPSGNGGKADGAGGEGSHADGARGDAPKTEAGSSESAKPETAKAESRPGSTAPERKSASAESPKSDSAPVAKPAPPPRKSGE